MANEPIDPTVTALPRWKCHKIVRAAKIYGIQPSGDGVFTQADRRTHGAMLELRHGGQRWQVKVSGNWVEKFDPKVGGYYVLYEDGYSSFSPAKAFEEGYLVMD